MVFDAASLSLGMWFESKLGGMGWFILYMLPAVALAGAVWWSIWAYRKEADVPFDDLLLRPPGESTRVAAEALFEKFSDRAGFLFFTCTVLALGIALAPAKSQSLLAAVFAVPVLVVTALTLPQSLRLVRRYWGYKLGFKGERLVGEQLNQLWAQGFHVFHDVPFDGYNVDHVVVGAAGVFAIETKTVRKPRAKATVQPAHYVRYDGTSLTWPSGRTNRLGLEQVARNARSLSVWLTQATGEAVACRSILTLPGWFIERTSKSPPEVPVIAAKALARYLASIRSTTLPLAQVRRISYQLSERCRIPADGETRREKKPERPAADRGYRRFPRARDRVVEVSQSVK